VHWYDTYHHLANQALTGPRRRRERLVLLAILIAFFLLTWAFGLSNGHVLAWKHLGVPTLSSSFFDMRNITAACESQRLGHDPLVENPRDPLNRPMNYPRIWLAPGRLGLDQSHTVILGVSLGVLFYISILLFSGRLSIGQGLLYAVVSCSPTALLAVERGNTDLLVFVLMAGALAATRRWRRSGPVFHAVVLIGSLLKLFPILALAAAVRERPRRALLAALGVAAVFGAYVAYTYGDLALIGRTVPKTWENSYGSMALLNYANALLGRSAVPLPFALLRAVSVAFLVVVLALAYLKASRKDLEPREDACLDGFRIGAAIYCGTFILGYSFNYRLLFLLFAMPQLVRWVGRRDRLGAVSSLALTGIILTLWSPLASRRFFFSFVLFAEELVNWFLFAGLAYLLLLTLPAWLKKPLRMRGGSRFAVNPAFLPATAAAGARGLPPAAAGAAPSGALLRRLLARSWPLLLFAFLALAHQSDLLGSPAHAVLNAPDIRWYLLHVHQYSRDHLLSGRIPLWNPYIYGGIPFAANPQASLFYPLSWFYLVMPVIQAHKWMIVVHTFLAGSFMYLLLRRFRLRQSAAVVGALPWMFGSYLITNAAVGHLTMVFTAAWLPLVVYLYDRTLAKPWSAWTFWTGFVLGVQFLAGEPQNAYYTALLMTMYGLVRTLSDAPEGRRRLSPIRLLHWIGSLAAIAVIAAVTSGVQLLPTAEMAAHSDRTASTYEFATTMSFHPMCFLGYLVPWSRHLLVIRVGGLSRAIELNWEAACYVGIVTLVLAAASLGQRGRSPLRAAYVAFGVAVLLMLGRHTPLHRMLFAAVPGLRLFRVPARAGVMATWALCVMSAFGMNWLLQAGRNRWRAPWRSRAWWRMAALAILAISAAVVVVVFGFLGVARRLLPTSVFAPFPFRHPVVLGSLLVIAATAGVVVALRWASRRVALGLICVLLIVDLLAARPALSLAPYSRRENPSLRTLREVRPHLDRPTGPARVDLAPDHVRANAAMTARVENVNGYWPVALRRFYRYVHAMRGLKPDPHFRHQLHNRLYSGHGELALKVMCVRVCSQVDAKRGKVQLLLIRDSMPRAWIADRAEVLTDEEAVLARMRQADFDPAATVILEKPPRIALSASTGPPGRAVVTRRDTDAIRLQTHSSRDGYLVLSEVFYPGWKATIDGREVPVERADYLITALPLPAGRHEVVYRYDPWTFKAGAALTAAACAAAAGVAAAPWFVRRRRKLGPAGS
jgi:hypothetical protein